MYRVVFVVRKSCKSSNWGSLPQMGSAQRAGVQFHTTWDSHPLKRQKIIDTIFFFFIVLAQINSILRELYIRKAGCLSYWNCNRPALPGATQMIDISFL